MVELFCGDELLGKRAAGAFRQHRYLGAKLIARRKVVLRLAIFVETFVLGDDTRDSVAFVNQFGAAELLEDVDVRGFHQPAQPFCDFAERDDIVAFVLERGRSDGEAEGGVFREEEHGGIRHWRVKRRGFFKIRHQFCQRLRIHNRAGKLVRANFAALLQNVNTFRRKLRLRTALVVLLDEIREVQRARKPRRSRADDEDVRFELFTLNGHHPT